MLFCCSYEVYSHSTQIEFTEQELAWLSDGHAVSVRVTDFPPYIIPQDEGEPKGISMDYLKLISERTGVRFEYNQSGKTFPQALDGLSSQTGPDLISSMAKTAERQKTIIFSEEYFSSPFMFFTRIDSKKMIVSIEDLNGLNIALVRGTFIQEMMNRQYPDFDLKLYDNDISAIEAVSYGEADVYLGNMMLTSYLILTRGPYNLKIVAPSPFDNHSFYFGIRKDWPELASIIDKGLSTITPEEQDEIRNRYVSIRYEQANYDVIIMWALIGLGIGLVVIVLFFFWNRILSKKVGERTALLEKEIAEWKNITEMLEDRNKYIESIIENLPIGFAINTIDDGNVKFINDRFEEIYGWSREVLTNTSVFFDKVFPDPDFRREMKEKIISDMESGKPERMRWDDLKIVTDAGEIRYVCAINIPIIEQNLMISTVQDVTKRKIGEDNILRSLKEKEILLQELYHRTKNNMQVIQSILKLSSMKSSSPDVQELVKHIENKIQTMSLVHQMLYESKDLSHINAHEYIEELTGFMMKNYDIPPQKISLILNVEEISLLLDTAIPIGLVVHELLSNSFEHGFPGDRTGEIRITFFKKDPDILTLIVADNGAGMPDSFNLNDHKSMGTKIIKGLVEKQLKGSIRFENSGGLICRIEFSESQNSNSA